MVQSAPTRKTSLPLHPPCVAEYVYEMACIRPITAYRSIHRNPDGTRSITFNRDDALPHLPVTLPCGQCIGCRLERSRQWAIRIMHEAQLSENNCFLTLTYDDKHLPSGGTLIKSDFQKFMKRLRRAYPEKSIRFFHCGEYGDTFRRPHYHAIIFNLDFDDKILFSNSNNIPLYTSPSLSKIWTSGFSTIGNVTFESAAYVARYALKKITGEKADAHYHNLIVETGELYPIQSEYITMSLRPAIGKKWLNKYLSDVYPSDELYMRGVMLKPPKYYDKLYDKIHPDNMKIIKENRIKEAAKHKDDQTPARLNDKRICIEAKLKTLSRRLQ